MRSGTQESGFFLMNSITSQPCDFKQVPKLASSVLALVYKIGW